MCRTQFCRMPFSLGGWRCWWHPHQSMGAHCTTNESQKARDQWWYAEVGLIACIRRCVWTEPWNHRVVWSKRWLTVSSTKSKALLHIVAESWRKTHLGPWTDFTFFVASCTGASRPSDRPERGDDGYGCRYRLSPHPWRNYAASISIAHTFLFLLGQEASNYIRNLKLVSTNDFKRYIEMPTPL